jgi:NADH-quinone oxidoreductase subunit E
MSTAPAAEAAEYPEVAAALKKWRRKRGAVIMALHEIQNQRGHVPRQAALELAAGLGVPLARIYEVITFYNYFKLKPPGRAVISVCTGTACHLKGAPALLAELRSQLGIEDGETTPDRLFHLQCVRCVGCCGLAPVVVVNGKTYGKLQPSGIAGLLAEWRERVAAEDRDAAD